MLKHTRQDLLCHFEMLVLGNKVYVFFGKLHFEKAFHFWKIKEAF